MRSAATPLRHAIAASTTLPAAGFVATMVSFGPARIGVGLFVPRFREEFSMSTATVGVVSSIGFAGFLAGLLVAQALLGRHGPAAPVLLGLTAATLGMGLVGSATNIPALAAGVGLAASSAGLTWSPFNAAVHHALPDATRPAALSRISSGTGAGVALAAIAAFAVAQSGWPWRASWVVFAAAGLGALVFNRAVLRRIATSPAKPRRAHQWRGLFGPRARSLATLACVMGTTSAIFIAFAAERMTQAGGVAGLPRDATAALVFLLYGVCGLSGLFTGRLRRRIGLAPLVRGALLAGALSAGSVAVLAGSWAGLVLSSGLQGLHVMVTSAIVAFWSERLYPARPSLGFTMALLWLAAGNMLGPVAGGVAAELVGAGPMFLGSAAAALLAALLLPRRHLSDRPETGP
ncbi:MAG: MFS transporter [Roseicyclus sp.]|jgi:predicted MFS family arabinose efflux permease|nr:MFS transporter [Roseicyclus sp.]